MGFFQLIAVVVTVVAFWKFPMLLGFLCLVTAMNKVFK